jgi:hypothetical protein
MFDPQVLAELEARFDRTAVQTAKAQKYLFKLVNRHGLDEGDLRYWRKPADAAMVEYELTDQEADALESMSHDERNAFDKAKIAGVEARRKEWQSSLPMEVRTALVRLNELRGAEYEAACQLANGMYQRGLIGLIADRLMLQEDSDVDLYSDRSGETQ